MIGQKNKDQEDNTIETKEIKANQINNPKEAENTIKPQQNLQQHKKDNLTGLPQNQQKKDKKLSQKQIKQKSQKEQKEQKEKNANFQKNHLFYKEFFQKMMVHDISNTFGSEKLKECQIQIKNDDNCLSKSCINQNIEPKISGIKSQDVMSQSSKKSSKFLSQKQSLYDIHKLFSLGQQANQKFVEQNLRKLKSKGVKVDFNSSKQDKVQIVNIYNASSNYRTLTIEIKMGMFSTNIQVLSLQEQHKHQIFHPNSGSSGKIYPAIKNNVEYIIKCQQKKQKNQKNQEKQENRQKTQVSQHTKKLLKSYLPCQQRYINLQFIQILKQFLFYKIFSILEIGPSLKNIYGYDIVIFQNCFQFSMEYCMTISDWKILISNQIENKIQIQQQMQNKIKKNLYLMHQLFIIHADIKDINMMYSPTYKKIVFIDFGTAYCLNNGAGHTTIIKKFFGTPFFSSPQMKQIGKKGNFQIDLYYNDAYMLKGFLDNLLIIQKSKDHLSPTQSFEQTEQQTIYQVVYHLQMNQLENAISSLQNLKKRRQELHRIKQQHKKKLQMQKKKKEQKQLSSKIIKQQIQNHKEQQIDIHFKILNEANKVNFTKATQDFFYYVRNNCNKKQFNQRQNKIINNLRIKIKIENQLFLQKRNKIYKNNNQNILVFEQTSKWMFNVGVQQKSSNKFFTYTPNMENILFDQIQSQKIYDQKKEVYFNLFLMSVLFKNSFFSSTIRQKCLASQIFLKIIQKKQTQFNILDLNSSFDSYFKENFVDQDVFSILISLFYIIKLCQNLQHNQVSFGKSEVLNMIWKKNTLLQILQTFAYFGIFSQEYIKIMVSHIIKYTSTDRISQLTSLINLKQIIILIQYQFYQKKHQISQQFYLIYHQIETKIIDQLSLVDIQEQILSNDNTKFQTFLIQVYKSILKYQFRPNLTNQQSELFLSYKNTLQKQYLDVCPSQVKQYLEYFLFRNKTQSYFIQNEIVKQKNASIWSINNKLIKKNNSNFDFINQFFHSETYDLQKIKDLMNQFDSSIRDQQIQQRFLLNVRIKTAQAQCNLNGNLLRLVNKLVYNFQNYVQNPSLNFPYYLYSSIIEIKIQKSHNNFYKKMLLKPAQFYKFFQLIEANKLLEKLCFNVSSCFFKEKQIFLQKQQLSKEQPISINIKDEVLIRSFTLFAIKHKNQLINSQNKQDVVKRAQQQRNKIKQILIKFSQHHQEMILSGSYNFYHPLIKQLQLIQSNNIFKHFLNLKIQFEKWNKNSINYQFLQNLQEFLSRMFECKQYKQQKLQDLKEIFQFLEFRFYQILMLSFRHNNYVFFIKKSNIYNYMVRFLLFKYERIKIINQKYPIFKSQFQSKQKPQFNMSEDQKILLKDHINLKLTYGKKYILNIDKLDGFMLFYRFLLKFANNSFGILRYYQTVPDIYKNFDIILNELPSNDALSLCYIILTQLKSYHKPVQCIQISPFFSIYLFCFAKKLTDLLYSKKYSQNQKKLIRIYVIEYMSIIQQVFFKQINFQFYIRQKVALVKYVFDVIYDRKNMKVQDMRVLYVVQQKEISNKRQYTVQLIQKIKDQQEQEKDKEQYLIKNQNNEIPQHLKNRMARKLGQKLNAITYLRWKPQKFKKCKENPKNRYLYKKPTPQNVLINPDFQKQSSFIQKSSSSSSNLS